MDTVTSKDGTTIAFDRLGDGPAVILVSGGSVDRSSNAGLAAVLASDFTVFNYDRRGRGPSGDTLPYAIEREIEDIEAVIGAAGGAAYLYGSSSGPRWRSTRPPPGCRSRSSRSGSRRTSSTRTPGRRPTSVDLPGLLAKGGRGDAAEYFMAKVVGMPAEFVAGARTQPWWAGTEALAHTLAYDAEIMGDYSMPTSEGREGGGADARPRRRRELRVHGPDGRRPRRSALPNGRAPDARGPGAQHRPERPRAGAEGVLRGLSRRASADPDTHAPAACRPPAHPLVLRPTSVDRLEVVLVETLGDLLPEPGALDIGGPEVVPI